MTREEKFNETIKHFTKEDQDIIKKDSAVGLSFLILQDFYEAQLKAKESDLERQDMIIKCLNIDLDNKEKLLKAKDEEIERLKAEHEIRLNHHIAQSARLRRYNPSRRIVAMLFWNWRVLKRTLGTNNTLTKLHKDVYIEAKKISFEHAYAMLKDNQ